MVTKVSRSLIKTAQLNALSGNAVFASTADLLTGTSLDGVISDDTFSKLVGTTTKCKTNGFYSGNTNGAADYTFLNESDSSAAGYVDGYSRFQVRGLDVYACLGSNKVSPQMLGALADGLTDDYNALNILFSKYKKIEFTEDCYTSSGLSGISNQSVSSYNNTGLIINTDINGITWAGKSKVNVTGLKVKCNSASTSNSNGLVFNNCQSCNVYFCEIEGISNNGVFVTGGSSKVSVRNCEFKAFLGSIQDSSDIAFYNGTSSCKAMNNECHGGNWHGIRCQLNSVDHFVYKNKVSQHKAYGILAGYELSDMDSGTIVDGNIVEDITGEVLIDGDKRAGAGIYCQSAYGIKIINNTIRRCNQETVTEVLAPGAIGASGRVVIDNNVIEDTAWYGIAHFSEDDSAIISNNIIKDSQKTAIYSKNGTEETVIDNNTIRFTVTPQRGIFVRHQTLRYPDVTVTNNTLINCSEALALFNVDDFVLGGNRIKGSTGRSINLESVTDGSIFGNNVKNSTSVALRVSDGTHIEVAGANVLKSTSGDSFVTTGTCDGINFDKSNKISPFSVNVVAGTIVEQRANSAPASGTWTVGSKMWTINNTAGGRLGDVCVTAGSPGTWKKFGNVDV